MSKTESLSNKSFNVINIPLYMKEFKNLYQNLKKSLYNNSIDDDYTTIKKQCQDISSYINSFKIILTTNKSKINIINLEKLDNITSMEIITILDLNLEKLDNITCIEIISILDYHLNAIERIENYIKGCENIIQTCGIKLQTIDITTFMVTDDKILEY